MRRLLRPLWVLLALIFLVEAWLWDRVEPVIARVVALIPLPRLKAWLADLIEHLSPGLTLIVFAVPVIVLFPLNFVAAWLLAHKYFVCATTLIVFQKVLGVGIVAFVFDVTREKLLQMAWFHRLYELVLDLRLRALAIVAPFKLAIQHWIRHVRRRVSPGFIARLRRRIQASRSSS
ncbi:MAG: hypothetical protein ACJAVZ_001709 [Afipia broomeae]|jgi:hypothetical protein|uniref:Uncharacterized protein n=1 Tax=Afipia broomeae ATCC 49717 TaxID=883078 RepID=K8P1J1_9BRAD|nr:MULTISPECIES: hypothetical protein [Afipia]MAH70947.1 hypothetical protein [Afipia sp.]OUX60058.1 MAG: hypothetical protein CBB64_17100 [Afipia sp. TMED4]RTL74698.1 MAG: hypothetical protein EKK35_24105 [Bradyrhizobiaceae bacterium]EKS34604.1 hypothetical protein HMPREF9695_04514 [Afipia broomeae ATCC 49717]HAO43058.1 hypothetical protein [Afipia sp.]